MSHLKMQISALLLLNNLGMKGLKNNEVKICWFKQFFYFSAARS